MGKLKPGGGFIVVPSVAEIDPATPEANLRALINNAVLKYGVYQRSSFSTTSLLSLRLALKQVSKVYNMKAAKRLYGNRDMESSLSFKRLNE